MKKRSLIVLLLVSFSSVSWAQDKLFSKNNVIYSGSFGGHAIVSENGDIVFNLDQKLGLMVSPKLMTGIGFEFDGDGGYGSSVFARYYLTNKKDFATFTQLGFDYFKTPNDTYNTKGYGITLSPGFNYMLTDGFGIETTLGLLQYRSSKLDTENSVRTNNVSLNLDFKNIQFGFIFKF